MGICKKWDFAHAPSLPLQDTLGLPHARHSDTHVHTFSFTAQTALQSTFLDVNYFSMKNYFLPCKFICMFFSPPELEQGSPGKGKHLALWVGPSY